MRILKWQEKPQKDRTFSFDGGHFWFSLLPIASFVHLDLFYACCSLFVGGVMKRTLAEMVLFLLLREEEGKQGDKNR